MTRLPTRAALLASTAMTRLPTLAFNTSVRRATGEQLDKNRAIDRATWSSMVASARLPTGQLDENRAIDCIAFLIPMVLHKLESGFSKEWLETALQKGLREGRPNLTRYAILAAEEADDEICDAALRHVAVEISRGELPERRPGHLHVQVYGERALLRGPHKRRQGHRWHDNYFRDIQICRLIDIARREFGVQPSRSSRRNPSGISLVLAALARDGIHRNEESIQQNVWFGLPGELFRDNAPTLGQTEITEIATTQRIISKLPIDYIRHSV